MSHGKEDGFFEERKSTRPDEGRPIDGDSAESSPHDESDRGDAVDDPSGTSLASGRGVLAQVNPGESSLTVSQDDIIHAVEEEAPQIARRITASRTSVEVRAASWSGPLPQPEDLQKYEDILPGLADRVVRMAEKALDSQVHTDRTLAEGDVSTLRRGQYLSTAIAALSVIGAIVLALAGAEWWAVAAVASPAAFQFASTLVRSVREPTGKSGGTANGSNTDDTEGA